MEILNQFQKATLSIMTISILIPILIFLLPKAINYLYYDFSFLKTFQIHRLLLSIFLSNFDINFFFQLLARHQFLSQIENQNLKIDQTDSSIELLFFTLTFIFPLFISNITEHLNSFSDSVNIAYATLMCDLMPTSSYFNFYGLPIYSQHFIYYYFFLEIIVSKMTSKCYYGLIFAKFYIYLRKNFFGVPECFVSFISYLTAKFNKIANDIRTRRKFGGPGRTLRKRN